MYLDEYRVREVYEIRERRSKSRDSWRKNNRLAWIQQQKIQLIQRENKRIP